MTPIDQLVIAVDGDGQTTIQADRPAPEVERHEAQQLFQPAPDVMRGQVTLTLTGLDGPVGRQSRADIGAAVGRAIGGRPFAGSPYPLGAGPYVARVGGHGLASQLVPVDALSPWLGLTLGECSGCAGSGRRDFPVPAGHPWRRPGLDAHACHDCNGSGHAHVHPESSVGRALRADG